MNNDTPRTHKPYTAYNGAYTEQHARDGYENRIPNTWEYVATKRDEITGTQWRKIAT